MEEVQGHRREGRRRHACLKNVPDWFNCGTASWYRLCDFKEEIDVLIANLHHG